MRAILVSVDYGDFLSITLPYNRHHFESVLVVTAEGSPDREIATRHGADVFVTDAFYRNGATFNKWLALEEGLDWMGRSGWLVVLDADVLWPRNILGHSVDPADPPNYLRHGHLYSPLRHMMGDVSDSRQFCHLPDDLAPAYDLPGDYQPYPPEKDWAAYPIHPNVNEWAGYTQIFHADDPHLGNPPWHEVNWRHAGGADSYFQQKWPKECKVRTPWSVLHLGRAGENWMGRASGYVGGGRHEDAAKRQTEMRELWAARRGRTGPHKYDHEKLGGES